jgi:thiol-disulfide isomerase/thioredoxin
VNSEKFYSEIRKMGKKTVRKGFLMFAAALMLLTGCKQKAPANEPVADTTVETTEPATETKTTYTDISLPGPQGQTVKVSDYVGKNRLVMIDFWASWCGPCMGEMPYVVKAYEMFHDKGLEIVGVSLDKDKASWLAAIEQTGQKWPQMSDLKGWDCEGAALYGIQSIPANVLINEQGEIVARDLRGDALLKEIESRLAAGTVAE